MIFQKKLDFIVNKNDSLVCVGLDSDYDKLPLFLKKKKYPQFEFNKAIIDATYDLVSAYKPNPAFYEARGDDGIKELKLTCGYLKKNYPQIPTILDAKRGDIGNTNQGYIDFAFAYLKVDAITLHPFLGSEALKPFLNQKDKGCIILCKTSNLGAGEFQDLQFNKKELYKIIAYQVVKKWNYNNNCLLVAGATYPLELANVRKIVGDMTLLVPGVGAQGGDVEKTIKAGLNSYKSGMIISSSRSIIFASQEKNFAQQARKESMRLKDLINKFRL